jgi:hypothetical protein
MGGVPSPVLAAGASALESGVGLAAGKGATEALKYGAKKIAEQGTKSLAGRLLGSVAATIAAPEALAETVATGGLGALAVPAIEMGAFAAGSYVGDKATEFVERLIGADKAIEQAKEENPLLSKAASLAVMAPMAYGSVKNLVKLGEAGGAKAVAKQVGGAALGGAAFEPIRYGVEAGIGALTGAEEGPSPITAESVGESALMAGILSAHGAREIERTVGSATAREAVKTPTDAAAEKTGLEEKKPAQYLSANQLVKTAEDRLKELNQKEKDSQYGFTNEEKEEHEFLKTFPSAEEIASKYGVKIRKEKEVPLSTFKSEADLVKQRDEAQAEVDRLKALPATSKRINENIKKNQRIVDSATEAIEGAKTLEAETARRAEKQKQEETKPDETETEKPEASRVSPVEGVAPVEPAEIKIEEGTAQREGEGQKEEVKQSPQRDAALAKKWAEVQSYQEGTPEHKKAFDEYIDISSGKATPTEEVKAPRKLEYAKTPDEADAWLKKALTNKFVNRESVQKRVDAHKALLEERGKEAGKRKAVLGEKVAKGKPQGTRLLAAAYRYTDKEGRTKIGYGQDHLNAMLDAGVPYKEVMKYKNASTRESENFGFKTDKDEFVSRDQAKELSRKSGQFREKAHEADKSLGYGFHSHHTDLDEYPRGLPIAPGAQNAAEGQHEKDLTTGANIHKELGRDENGNFAGGADFNDWKQAFISKNKKAAKYTNDRLATIFRESEGVAAHSEFFQKPIEQSVNSRKTWETRSVDEIRQASTQRRTEDIRLSNKNINELRKARKYEPIMKEAEKSHSRVWDEAMNRMNDNQYYQKNLIESLKYNMGPISDVNQAVLAHAVASSMEARDAAVLELSNVKKTKDKALIAEKQQKLEDAEREFLTNTSLLYRAGTPLGRALNFRKAILKADYSPESVLNKARAAKRKAGSDEELTDEESKRALEAADKLKASQEQYYKMLEDQKLKQGIEGLASFLEASKKAQSLLEGERPASPKQELNRHSSMLRANPNDPLNVALSVRGMARNLSELLDTTNPRKIANEIHERIKDTMGDGWDKESTMAVLNGYGAFTQSTEKGIMGMVKSHEEKMANYEKAVNDAMKRKTSRERNLALDKAAKKYNVDIREFESQLSSHLEDLQNDIAKALGELENHIESCV